MTREEVLKLFPEATDEAISRILNLHHAEVNAAKKADADAAQKAAHAEEQAQEIAALNEQIKVLTANYAAARKESNLASAISALTGAGMPANLAKVIAESTVSDDPKASNSTISGIVSAYSAMEQARANQIDQKDLKGMPQPQGGGSVPDQSVELAKRLASNKATHSTSGTLDAFKS